MMKKSEDHFYNKTVKFYYKGEAYLVTLNMEQLRDDFRYCGETSVKKVLAEVRKPKNVKLL